MKDGLVTNGHEIGKLGIRDNTVSLDLDEKSFGIGITPDAEIMGYGGDPGRCVCFCFACCTGGGTATMEFDKNIIL